MFFSFALFSALYALVEFLQTLFFTFGYKMNTLNVELLSRRRSLVNCRLMRMKWKYLIWNFRSQQSYSRHSSTLTHIHEAHSPVFTWRKTKREGKFQYLVIEIGKLVTINDCCISRCFCFRLLFASIFDVCILSYYSHLPSI